MTSFINSTNEIKQSNSVSFHFYGDVRLKVSFKFQSSRTLVKRYQSLLKPDSF